MPTRQLYDLIFKDDDVALKQYLKRTQGGENDLFE
jgi:hypothetical protein